MTFWKKKVDLEITTLCEFAGEMWKHIPMCRDLYARRR